MRKFTDCLGLSVKRALLVLSMLSSAGASALPNNSLNERAQEYGQTVLASEMAEVEDCSVEASSDATRVFLVSCVSQVYDRDVPCFDPESPSGLEMCFGVAFHDECSVTLRRSGSAFKVIGEPQCESVKQE